jgi:hypothetical protein
MERHVDTALPSSLTSLPPAERETKGYDFAVTLKIALPPFKSGICS